MTDSDKSVQEQGSRESCVYYIHRWQNPPSPEDVKVTMPEMEAYMMHTFGEEVQQLRDPLKPEMKAFYHDHGDGGKLQFATPDSFTDGSRSGVRRVLGCGHFLLCVLFMTLNCMEEQEGDAWPYARFWPDLRKDAHSLGLLDPQLQCDPNALYTWLTSHMFRRMFERIPDGDPYKEHVRTPLTKLKVTSPCTPGVDGTTDEFMENYQEFLVVHLHVMNEMQMLEEPYHTQYLLLLRKGRDAEVSRPRPGVTFSREGSLWAAMSFRRRRAVSEPAIQTSDAQEQQTVEQQPVDQQKRRQWYAQQQLRRQSSPTFSLSSSVARGAGQTRTVEWQSRRRQDVREEIVTREETVTITRENISASVRRLRAATVTGSRWRKSESFRASTGWRRSRSAGATALVRVTERHWRLGCRGCPAVLVARQLPAAASKATAGGGKRRWRLRRFCKWVTIKRTVLVKRPALVRKQRRK